MSHCNVNFFVDGTSLAGSTNIAGSRVTWPRGVSYKGSGLTLLCKAAISYLTATIA
jgi:hypothetical protein